MVMILGDLHISDVFKGKHKDYLQNCMWVLKEITKKIEETKPSAVVLGGDLIGWTETNIRDRQILSTFCKYLREWNDICPVYSVRGNHDIKGYPDFMFLSELGLIITSTKCGGYFDYYGEENAAWKLWLPSYLPYMYDFMEININTGYKKICDPGHPTITTRITHAQMRPAIRCIFSFFIVFLRLALSFLYCSTFA